MASYFRRTASPQNAGPAQTQAVPRSESAEAQVAKLQADLDLLQGVRAQNDTLKTQMHDMDAKRATLEAQLASLQQQPPENGAVADLHVQKANLESAIRKLLVALRQATHELDTERNLRRDEPHDAAPSAAELQEAQLMLQQQSQLALQAQQAQRLLQAQLAATENQLKETRSELEALKQPVHPDEAATLASDAAAAKSRAEALEQQLAELQTTHTAAMQKLRDLESAFEKVSSENSALLERLSQQQRLMRQESTVAIETVAQEAERARQTLLQRAEELEQDKVVLSAQHQCAMDQLRHDHAAALNQAQTALQTAQEAHAVRVQELQEKLSSTVTDLMQQHQRELEHAVAAARAEATSGAPDASTALVAAAEASAAQAKQRVARLESELAAAEAQVQSGETTANELRRTLEQERQTAAASAEEAAEMHRHQLVALEERLRAAERETEEAVADRMAAQDAVRAAEASAQALAASSPPEDNSSELERQLDEMRKTLEIQRTEAEQALAALTRERDQTVDRLNAELHKQGVAVIALEDQLRNAQAAAQTSADSSSTQVASAEAARDAAVADAAAAEARAIRAVEAARAQWAEEQATAQHMLQVKLEERAAEAQAAAEKVYSVEAALEEARQVARREAESRKALEALVQEHTANVNTAAHVHASVERERDDALKQLDESAKRLQTLETSYAHVLDQLQKLAPRVQQMEAEDAARASAFASEQRDRASLADRLHAAEAQLSAQQADVDAARKQRSNMERAMQEAVATVNAEKQLLDQRIVALEELTARLHDERASLLKDLSAPGAETNQRALVAAALQAKRRLATQVRATDSAGTAAVMNAAAAQEPGIQIRLLKQHLVALEEEVAFVNAKNGQLRTELDDKGKLLSQYILRDTAVAPIVAAVVSADSAGASPVPSRSSSPLNTAPLSTAAASRKLDPALVAQSNVQLQRLLEDTVQRLAVAERELVECRKAAPSSAGGSP